MKLLGMIADHPTQKISGGTAYTLNSRDYKGVMIVVLSKSKQLIKDELEWNTNRSNPDLTKLWGGQRMPDKNNFNCVIEGGDDLKDARTVVRRLTPLECERLQGFPDGWTLIGEEENGEYYYTDSNGKRKKVTDSARYKALGNSICLPFWQWLARRIAAQYERDITMGSLFDGIGGFPYVFERVGAKAVWASEIEEFPIAVTKQHFPEEE